MRRVLVIDADEPARDRYREALEPLEVELTFADDGAKGLEMFKSDGPFHMVIVDIFAEEENPGPAEEPEPEPDEPEPAAATSSGGRAPLAPEFVEKPAAGVSASDAEGEEGEDGADPVAAAPTGACAWCRADLPSRDNLNFCPFCGTDLTLIPCSSCGEEVASDWRFCAACGSEAVR